VRVEGDGGVGLEVKVTGPEDAPAVLFMHGWPDSHLLWRHQVAAVVAAGYRAIAPDLRGFGESDKPTAVEAYRIVHSVADMVAVLDACGVEKARIVAHDWGAVPAWGLAAFVPERVDRLVALSTGHPRAFAEAGFEQKMRSLYMLLFDIPVVAEHWFGQFGAQMLAGHPDRDDVLADLAREGALTASFNWYRANAHPRTLIDPPPKVPSVRCPVLGVWSTRDPALTEEQMTKSEAYVDGPWRYERIEGAGHWMQLDAHDEVNAVLLDFLK
jgi:pimeloyl-ACP methyl ester carboxylesterase